MIPFATDRLVNYTCMALTLIAGLGFLVWDDISNNILTGIKNKYSIKRIIKNFNLHTKIVLIMQISLFIIGTVGFLFFEYGNVETLESFSLNDKILVSAFQSVSARTSGFASVNISRLNDITKLFMTVLMLIGGGSGSMAGGIKTTTVFVIIAGVISSVIGKKHINIFKKTIPQETFIKAVSVVTITAVILLISNIILIANCKIKTLDLLFESVSAIATVGLTSGALEKMNLLCRSIIVLLMYIGRIGTVTMAMSFIAKRPKENDSVVYSKENIIVG